MADNALSFEDWLQQYKDSLADSQQNSSQPEAEPNSDTLDNQEAQNYPAGEPLPEMSPAEVAAEEATKNEPAGEAAPDEQEAQVPGPERNIAQADEADQDEEIPAPKATANKKEAAKEAKEAPAMPNMAPMQAQSGSTPMDYIQALRDAQDEQKRQLALAQIQRGGAQMLAGATHTRPDYTNAEAIEKQAGLPIQNLQQQIAVQNVQSQLNNQKEMSDPNSEISKNLRQFGQKLGFKLSDNVSGMHIQQIAPYMVKAYDAEESRKARIEAANIAAQSRTDVAGIRGAGGDKKTQDSAYQKALTQLNTSRLPPDVKQAKIDQYLASKANLIFNKYGDLNQISEQEKNQLLAELGKIAQGGVPTAQELKGIDPDTYSQRVNHFISQLTNVPQGAQVGDFLQRQKSYLNDLSQNAQDRIDGYKNDVISEYEPVMGKEHADKLRTLNAPKPQAGSTLKVKVPAVGEVQKGYKFKGGDPADKNNWEKVQ